VFVIYGVYLSSGKTGMTEEQSVGLTRQSKVAYVAYLWISTYA